MGRCLVRIGRAEHGRPELLLDLGQPVTVQIEEKRGVGCPPPLDQGLAVPLLSGVTPVVGVAKLFGADLVGICAHDERWIYSQRYARHAGEGRPVDYLLD